MEREQGSREGTDGNGYYGSGTFDQERGLALVEIVAEKHTTEEIDITLVESVAPGDLLLVHGGVAIANL